MIKQIVRQKNGTIADVDNAAYNRRLAQKSVDKRLLSLEQRVEDLKKLVHNLRDLLPNNFTLGL